MKNKITKKIAALFFLNTSTFCFATDSDEEHPLEHLCPITQEVMKDPVVAADGQSYERKAIESYFKSTASPKSPITGLPLNSRDLFTNQNLKKMIMEWTPGTQHRVSTLSTRPANEIAQRIRDEFAKNAVLLDSAKGQNIVAFLGNTGAGKSTLINLLSEKALRISDDQEDYVLVDPTDPTAMVIGIGGNSETLYPKFIDVNGLRFFDLPGFNDTDGSERNLINAAFIRKILLDAASVRLVFVVGQDQFTADRSSSVRQMFHSLKQLFVFDGDINLVDNGVLVLTKVMSAPQADLTQSLIKRTDSRDKASINELLQVWSKENRLARMYHPVRDEYNKDIKNEILSLIKGAKLVKIHGVNVSALYPSDTKGALERMFDVVLEEKWKNKNKENLVTLSDYDQALAHYSAEDFWTLFETNLLLEDKAIGLLKEFCTIPYNSALKKFQHQNIKSLEVRIENLEKKKQERIQDIETRTKSKAKEVISSFVPEKVENDFINFDFAYHRDFYDRVCGPQFINQLATDPAEQEIVRRYYAGFISKHSHKQILSWFEKYAGLKELSKKVEELDNQFKITQTNIAALNKNPANKGDEEAAYNLGKIYAQGLGVEKDETEAVKWYQIAAANGHKEAQYNLGLLYKNGRGVKKNEKEAVEWFQKAAEQGHKEAQYNLGGMYEKGLGVDQDYDTAREQYEEAAEQALAEAQYALGRLYEKGLGVKQDYNQALKWYEKAAEQGQKEAQNSLGTLYKNGQGVEQDYIKAKEYYEKAATQGDKIGQSNLGHLYKNGQGVEQDYTKAKKWYEKAAEQGNASAQNSLGLLYNNGRGVKQDYKQALKWYEKAAEQGNAAGQNNLGNLYKNGRGVEQDYKQALRWYEKAAGQGDKNAQHNFGVLYHNGLGVQQNYEEAKKWFEKAAKQGHENAQKALQDLKD